MHIKNIPVGKNKALCVLEFTLFREYQTEEPKNNKSVCGTLNCRRPGMECRLSQASPLSNSRVLETPQKHLVPMPHPVFYRGVL